VSARLAPRDAPYPDGMDDTLRRLMGDSDRPPLALFRTIAHHPEMLERFRQVGSTLLSFGRLEATERETIIHRTAARTGAAYEWGVHAAIFAGPLGLGEAWLHATWHGAPDDPAFSARQALLVRACDELHDTSTLTDATWTALRDGYDDAELVEIVCLAGFYHLVGFLCGAFGVEREAWALVPPGAVASA
jgi:4-carboxymuconolactone decarboxylase